MTTMLDLMGLPPDEQAAALRAQALRGEGVGPRPLLPKLQDWAGQAMDYIGRGNANIDRMAQQGRPQAPPAAPMATQPPPQAQQAPVAPAGPLPGPVPPQAPAAPQPPPQPRALPKAIGAATTTSTSTGGPAPMAPVAQSTPDAQAGLEARRAQYEQELEGLNVPADYSTLQAQARERQAGARSPLVMSLIAQSAGKGFEPFTAHYLKKSAEMGGPMKIEGGQIDESGNVMLDPAFQRQRQIESVQRRLAAVDAAIARAQSQEERLAYEKQRDKEMMEFRRISLAQTGALAQQRINAAGDKADEGRPLAATKVEDLAGMSGDFDRLGSLMKSFKPEYGPYIAGTGKLTNAVGKLFGTDSANWHSRYQEYANAVLKRLSGAAVTESEAQRFNDAMITANTPEHEIPRRLAQQQEAIASGHNKLIQYYGQAGYKTGGFQPITPPGAPAPGSRAPAPAPAQAPAPARAAPKVGHVEGGYRFKGGDPSKPENWVKQ